VSPVPFCRGPAKPLPKGAKGVKLDPGEKHRLQFDLRDGVLGPEYVSSGVHVPRHIQELVAKDFCMQRRRAHVKVLEAFKVAKAEEKEREREADMMQRTKRMMQGKGAGAKENEKVSHRSVS
jgi:hypothetical protein